MACPIMPKPSRSSQNRKKPSVQPRPFKSILLPHAQDILAWRRAGKTWQEVVNELAKRNVKTDTSAACRFIERYRRRPYPRGAEPEETPAPAPAKEPAAGPQPSPDMPAPDVAERISAKVDRNRADRESARRIRPVDDL
jgi:hypothetical protein